MPQAHLVVGKNIVRIRTRIGLTQQVLAERAEISHRYLQSVEAGEKQPSINVISQIRKALMCDWDDLLRGI